MQCDMSVLATPSLVLRKRIVCAQRIFPPDQTSHLVRNGQVVRAETVSEFGVYSVFVSDAAGGIVCNEAAGHLLRTKVVTTALMCTSA
jgi:hypothetical protein